MQFFGVFKKLVMLSVLFLLIDSSIFAARKNEYSEGDFKELIQTCLLCAHVECYAHLDENFLASPTVEYVYKVSLPKHCTREKALSLFAPVLDDKIVTQLRNPETRLQAKVKHELLCGRGPFEQKDSLGDKIDIVIDHEQGFVKVIVERDPAFYIPAKKAYDARMAMRKKESTAEAIFEWYQLHHQA